MSGRNFKDLTNMKFHHLLVIKRAPDRISKSGNRTIMWECECDCGNQNHVIVSGFNLRNGRTKSCGCLKSPDLTGERFGRLTVLCQDGVYTNKDGKKQKQWLCKCDCGKTKTVLGNNLKRGKTLSCGCYSSEVTSKNSKKYNDYEIQEDYVIMYTAKGEMFLVDLEDFWKVKNVCWRRTTGNYLRGIVDYHKEMQLHDFIMECPKGMVVDHKHGRKSRYDNRKENLRLATFQENARNASISKSNTSGVTGVYWSKKIQKWVARITVDYQTKHLGSFVDKDEAIKARKEAENKYFGEFSYDNSQRL